MKANEDKDPKNYGGNHFRRIFFEMTHVMTGVRLEGKNLHHYCCRERWDALLQLAYCYGWRPAGTTWDARDSYRYTAYFANEGQFVTPSDAGAWADTLERAVNEIDDNFAMIINCPNDEYPVLYTPGMVYDARDVIGDFSTGSTISHGYLIRAIVTGVLCKSYIEEFINFCRESDGFNIW